MQTEQLIGLVNLMNVKGLGPAKTRSLVARFKSPAGIFDRSVADLCRAELIDLRLAEAIRSYKQFEFGEKIVEQLHLLQAEAVTLWDADYPELLKKIYDPPLVLFTIGRPLVRREDCIALVGTRAVTLYGRKVAAGLAGELTGLGLTSVSGLARGVDTVIHQETVRCGGRTIAVLGSGIDTIYPAENRSLAERIQEKGTIITEFLPGTKPDAGNFPQRNRIISGLSHGTVVVEAGHRSGAILTALNAIDQNREVFAVPGRITDKQSIGCLRLIKHGAIPVSTAEDIMTHIQNKLFFPRHQPQQELDLDFTPEEDRVMRHLSFDPVYIDDLVEATGIELTRLLTILLELELKNAIVQLSGKQFVRA